MKLTNKQLKQIIAEELREVMVAPSNPTERALKDPQVPEKIKDLLKQKDPENRKYGVYLLTLMFPDDYPAEEIEGYQGSEEYEKSFKKDMRIHKDVSKLQAIKDDFEKLPGNVRASFSSKRLHIVSKDRKALENAIEYSKEKYHLFPERQYQGLGKDPYIITRRMMGNEFYSAMFKMYTPYDPQAIELMKKMDEMKG
jgi:hypothetical protein